MSGGSKSGGGGRGGGGGSGGGSSSNTTSVSEDQKRKAREKAERCTTRTILQRDTCKIEPEIALKDNMQVIMFTVMAEHLASDATTFADFRPQAQHKIVQSMFQYFIRIVCDHTKAVVKTREYVEKKKAKELNKAKKKKKPAGKKKKSRRGSDDDDDEMDEDDDDDEAEEAEESDDDNRFLNEVLGRGAHGRLDEDEEEALRDPQAENVRRGQRRQEREDAAMARAGPDGIRTTPTRLFVETLLDKSNSSKTSSNLLRDRQVVGYRWIYINNSDVTLEHTGGVTFATMESAGKLAELKNRNNHDPNLKTYLVLRDRGILMRFHTNMIGMDLPMAEKNLAESLPIDNKSNPLNPVKLFAPTWSMHLMQRSNRVIQGQMGDYIQLDDHRIHKVFKPVPEVRKFMINIVQSDMQEHILHYRMLPDVQCKDTMKFARMIPVILNQFSQIADSVQKKVAEDEPAGGAGQVPPDEEQSPAALEKARKAREEMFKEYNAKYGTMGEAEVTELLEHNHSPPSAAEVWATARISLGLMHMDVDANTINKMVNDVYSEYRYNSQETINAAIAFTNSSASTFLANRQTFVRKIFLLNQESFLDAYKNEGQMAASPAGLAVIQECTDRKFFEKPPIPTGGIFKYVEPVSVFGFMEMRFGVIGEHIYKLNDQHALWRKCIFAAWDSFRKYQGVHQNVLICSAKGARGKSYTIQLLHKDILIPKTCESLMHQSLKSRIVNDANYDDFTFLWEEMPRELISKDGGDAERMYKQMLSASEILADILNVGNGERVTNRIYVRANSTFIGATNEVPERLLEPAMIRRMDIQHADEFQKPKRSIPETEAVKELNKGSGTTGTDKQRTDMNTLFHLKQALMYHVEKLIYCGILHQVSKDVMVAICYHLSNEIMNRGYPEPNPSFYERIEVAARANCIFEKITQLWLMQGGEFTGSRITWEQFKRLDGHLWINTHHAVKAIGDHINLLINPAETAIRRALIEIHRDVQLGETLHESSAYLAPKNKLINPSYMIVGTFTKNVAVSGSNETSKGGGGGGMQSGENSHFFTLANKILNKMKTMEMDSAPPVLPMVIDVLKRWQMSEVDCYDYEPLVGKATDGLQVEDVTEGVESMLLESKSLDAQLERYGSVKDAAHAAEVAYRNNNNNPYKKSFAVDRMRNSNNNALGVDSAPAVYLKDEEGRILVRRKGTSVATTRKPVFYSNPTYVMIHRDWLFNVKDEDEETKKQLYDVSGWSKDPRVIHNGNRVIESILQEILGHDGQPDRLIIYQNDTARPKEVLPLLIKGGRCGRALSNLPPGQSPNYLKIQSPTPVSQSDKFMMDNYSKYKTIRRDEQLIIITQCLDQWGLDRHNERIGLTRTPIKKEIFDVNKLVSDARDKTSKNQEGVYDEEGPGYFKGHRIDELLSASSSANTKAMTEEVIKGVCAKLDAINIDDVEFQRDPLMYDVDFDAATWVLTEHSTKDPLLATYHWDVLAREESNGSDTLVEYHKAVTTNKASRWMYVHVPVPDPIPESMSIDDLKKRRRMALFYNIPTYKFQHSHPTIVTDWFNRKARLLMTPDQSILTAEAYQENQFRLNNNEIEELLRLSASDRYAIQASMSNEEVMLKMFKGEEGYRGKPAGYEFQPARIERDEVTGTEQILEHEKIIFRPELLNAKGLYNLGENPMSSLNRITGRLPNIKPKDYRKALPMPVKGGGLLTNGISSLPRSYSTESLLQSDGGGGGNTSETSVASSTTSTKTAVVSFADKPKQQQSKKPLSSSSSSFFQSPYAVKPAPVSSEGGRTLAGMKRTISDMDSLHGSGMGASMFSNDAAATSSTMTSDNTILQASQTNNDEGDSTLPSASEKLVGFSEILARNGFTFSKELRQLSEPGRLEELVEKGQHHYKKHKPDHGSHHRHHRRSKSSSKAGADVDPTVAANNKCIAGSIKSRPFVMNVDERKK